jgi:FixJ family two-component response regulator/tRNA A-37 threonylcarbamoyl transferase component Bud32
MRFLIVDQSSEFRGALAGMLRARWPEAQTDDWDPRQRGDPGGNIAGGGYSAVLLESHPAGEDGIAWVERMRRDPKAPPVVLIADQGDTHVAIQALKAGAADFLRRSGLTAERLARALEDALREHEARQAEQAARSTLASSTRLDWKKIGAPLGDNVVRIPGYRSLRMIGRGGMAQVYLAERVIDGTQLVLKVLDRSLRKDAVFLKRFQREYRLISVIENEHVARIFDQGFTGEYPYIAMEYLSGGTLAARIYEGMTSLVALRLTAQIARALDAIHAHGIVHRDLKPQNIMFRDNGRPVIVDFGLAKDLGGGEILTQQGQVMATPRYMSPEQCMGQPADARSDLYSLGVMFYEMISGHKLFESEGPAGLVKAHVYDRIPALPERLAGYQGILDRLLAKKPEERFQSARELFATIAV